jgi:hypothetical protein
MINFLKTSILFLVLNLLICAPGMATSKNTSTENELKTTKYIYKHPVWVDRNKCKPTTRGQYSDSETKLALSPDGKILASVNRNSLNHLIPICVKLHCGMQIIFRT